MKNKRAAMEMSVGTIVTVVLLMAVLILGVFLVQGIFTTTDNVINEVDRKVNDEINKLFTQDSNKKVVIFPESPVIKQGNTGGIGISIKNPENQNTVKLKYNVLYESDDCGGAGDGLISLGASTTNAITLGSGQQMDSARLLRFRTTESTPICEVSYLIDVYHSDTNQPYAQKNFVLQVIS